ncbi:MAG: methyl-accepting chemotaxis protein [Candidatus Kapaibacterium sp.]|nr:MAG: methyl-accepting chemotaxis protein [Candidatus Kapabacteria bacterium]
MQEFFMQFIPAQLRTDTETLRRARTIVATCFLSSLIAFAYMFQYIFLVHNLLGALALFLATAFLLALPFILRSTGKLDGVAHCLVASYLFTATVLVSFEGGHDTITRIWIAIVPLLATMFTGLRGGIQWLIASLSILAIFFALKLAGIEVPKFQMSQQQIDLQGFAGMVGIAVLVSLLAQIYERGKNASLQELDAVRKESERRAQEDYQRLDLLKADNERRAAEDLAKTEQQKQYLATNVETALHAIDRIAEGDLRVRLHSNTNDDIARLFHGLTQSVQNISAMISHVVYAVNSTADAVSQISGATEELASGAKEQHGQVMHLAGAVEQMSRSIADNTQQISVAAYEASQANDDAYQSEQVMRGMISNVQNLGGVVISTAEKITRLGASSEKIGEIVSVIDEIADQTNLLALNAAIEAARAGESGRGFAVVADEVRKLAERTQKATKEISQMIKTIQNEMTEAVRGMNEGTTLVQQGEKLVGQTTQALEKIINRTSKVSDLMSQVASASDMQATTSNDMAQNMETMSAVVEQTTQGVQNIAHSIEQLLRQTDDLRNTTNRFVLGEDAQQTPLPAATRKQLRR